MQGLTSRIVVACATVFSAAVMLSPSRAALAQDAGDASYEYVVSISRDPARRWFECRRAPSDAAFRTDSNVAGYYPYHFSRGEEHYVVVQPVESMTVYWLTAEERHLGLVALGASSLAECEGKLIEIRRAASEQRKLKGQLRSLRPKWTAALEAEKERCIARLGLKVNPAEFDVLKTWDDLEARKAEMLQEREPAPPEQKAPEVPKQPAIPERLPGPAFLLAEPTPNDSGVHVTVRWPVDALDFRRKAVEKRAAAEEAGTQPQKHRLTPAEEAELKDIARKLSLLRKAHMYAVWLSESLLRSAEQVAALGEMRAEYLDAAGSFCKAFEAVVAESKVHAGGALGVDAEAVTPELLKARLAGLSDRLEEARRRGEAPDAKAADYDVFDELRYARQLAGHYVDTTEKRVSRQEVEADLLWQLAQALTGAELPAPEPAKEAAATGEDQLLGAVSELRRAGTALDVDGSEEAMKKWKDAQGALAKAESGYADTRKGELESRLAQGRLAEPQEPFARRELSRLSALQNQLQERMRDISREHAGRTCYFRLGVGPVGGGVTRVYDLAASTRAHPAGFDRAEAVNLLFVLFFAGVVLYMIAYVRRHPDVFVRRIEGLEAVDEAIGRATEMGKPAVFVHGLSGVGDISVLASLSILGRIARRIAEYDSDLLVVNNDPIVYSVSYEVVQEGYMEAGRPDAFKPDNIFMAASDQFPYVAAVAGIMARRRPAANFFMGYFYAEALILAEAGAMTGAIQIAGTDSFTQLPFFVTTCDYTLMGEELYAAGAYLSREPKMLGTLKAQDVCKAVLLGILALGAVLGSMGVPLVRILFTAYEKGG